MPSAGQITDDQAIRDELAKILASSTFARSSRLRRFLAFVVEDSLGGRTPKESIIGLEVFGKTANWDAQHDSAVRVGAKRLRSLLDVYYRTEGNADVVTIKLEPGSYAPIFSASSPAEAAPLDIPPSPLAANPSTSDIQPASTRTRLGTLVSCGVLVLLLTAVAVTAALRGSFGVAIGLFVPVIGFVSVAYMEIKDTPYSRIGMALFTVAAMSYILSALTLPEVMATVVNSDALPPSLIYPAITGLKFIPLFPLVFGYWVLLRALGDSAGRAPSILTMLYNVLGPVFLAVTWFCGLWLAGDYRVWEAKIPGRGFLVGGYAVAYALNIAVWRMARILLIRDSVLSYRRLLSLSWIAFLPLALAAYVVDHQYNVINQHYLDRRHPEAYAVANPEGITEFMTQPPAEIGKDLYDRLENPEFRRALRSERFYKQNFDEAFQVTNRAVMFGYKARSTGDTPSFVIIRFPKALADTLEFEPVGETK